MNSSKFKERTTWNNWSVSSGSTYNINGLFDGDVHVWSINCLQNLKRAKELCGFFTLYSFGQPKPSPDRSSLKLTLKQEVEFCISTRWFDGTSADCAIQGRCCCLVNGGTAPHGRSEPSGSFAPSDTVSLVRVHAIRKKTTIGQKSVKKPDDGRQQ